MQPTDNNLILQAKFAAGISLISGFILGLSLAGCGGNNPPKSTTATPPSPQNYYAPPSEIQSSSLTNAIDDVANTYSEVQYPGGALYSQVLNAGKFTVNQRGLRSLELTAQYVDGNLQIAPTCNPPLLGGFALELAGQAGGLIQPLICSNNAPLVAPVTPMVAATSCPSLSAAQSYLFVTLPGSSVFWNPATDTAYGTADISTSGTSVNFSNIQQFTLPSAGGSGTPAQRSSASKTGLCGPTSFGSLVAVPGQIITTDPGGANDSRPPQAHIGIGSNDLLVEDNGYGTAQYPPGTSLSLPYENVLGAGYGAVGLPRSSSSLNTGTVVGSQYLGFIYALGYPSTPAVPFSSHVASFGFSTTPSACSSVTTSTGTLIYGGDFKNDDPSASPDGFGNCDFAIDLGSQESSTNGLYRNATVWVGASYSGNTTRAQYSFPAVAIAGQLSGKYAVFLLGQDSKQPWAIYLLQSN